MNEREAMIPDEVIIRAGTNMLAHTDMVPLEFARQLVEQLKEARKVLARVKWQTNPNRQDLRRHVNMHHMKIEYTSPASAHGQTRERIEREGDGSLDWMVDGFRALLVAAGYTPETAAQLQIVERGE